MHPMPTHVSRITDIVSSFIIEPYTLTIGLVDKVDNTGSRKTRGIDADNVTIIKAGPVKRSSMPRFMAVMDYGVNVR